MSEYFNNRTISNVGYQKVPLRFVIDDSTVHLPVANAQITITPGDIKKKTTEQGNAQVKSLVGGTYSVTISKAGYVTQTFM